MLNKTKTIAVLGATGSIGTQTLSVIKDHADLFNVVLLSAGSNELLLCNQAKIFRPKYVIINTEDDSDCADFNSDNLINIQDIILIVNEILS